MKPLVCPQDFLENDVCALHFVGWRKSGMPAVFEARAQFKLLTYIRIACSACPNDQPSCSCPPVHTLGLQAWMVVMIAHTAAVAQHGSKGYRSR